VRVNHERAFEYIGTSYYTTRKKLNNKYEVLDGGVIKSVTYIIERYRRLESELGLRLE